MYIADPSDTSSNRYMHFSHYYWCVTDVSDGDSDLGFLYPRFTRRSHIMTSDLCYHSDYFAFYRYQSAAHTKGSNSNSVRLLCLHLFIMARFQHFSTDDVENFVESHENKNTMRKTATHLRLLKEFLRENNEEREVNQIPACELDTYLAKYFVSVRTVNGDEYEPSSLRGMLGSFERLLKRQRYGYSLITSFEFSKTRDALKAKQKNLKAQGRGNKPMKSEPLTDSDVEKLYECGQLGLHTPTSVINSLWFNNTLYFGMRGGATEHRDMQWGDITLRMDDDRNLEYLEYNERMTKTRSGEDVRNTRVCPPRMYATPEDSAKCPVAVYKLYAEKRPPMPDASEQPFYLAVVTNNPRPSPQDQWFLRGPMGENKLGKLMQNMAKVANLPENKRISNTSVRKTLVTKMTDSNVPDTLQVYVTGHKNIQSLNNYRSINNDQKFAISRVLSGSRQHMASASATCVSHTATTTPAVDWTSAPVIPSDTRHTTLGQHSETARQLEPQPGTSQIQSSQSHRMESLFAGANIYGGKISVNINCNYGQPIVKRRRIIVDSDSD